jgi:hypothetical protein
MVRRPYVLSEESSSRRARPGTSGEAPAIGGGSQAEYWVSSYRNLIAHESEILLGWGRALRVMPAGDGRAMSADERLLRDRLLRYRARLAYWQDRVGERPAGGHC